MKAKSGPRDGEEDGDASQRIDEEALKSLFRAAVALNTSGSSRR